MITDLRSRRTFLRSVASVALLAVVAFTASQAPASADESLAEPVLTSQATYGWWVGTPISASGNLSGAVNPTGSITFNLYGPSDPTCSDAPLFTASTPVSGNGYYVSSRFTTDTAGTYRWVSRYSGDANNNPTTPSACGLASATTSAAKRNVSLTSDASDVSADGVVTNTAYLRRGVGPTGPTGTITWMLYGPNNNGSCAGTPLFTSVRAVNANGNYRSLPFTLTTPGNYSWRAVYSGDTNNNMQFTMCTDPANQLDFVATVLPMSLTSGQSVIDAGDALTLTWSGVVNPTSADWIALYPVGGTSPVAWRYTGGTTSGTMQLTVPATLRSGSYEARFRTVKSGVVTVN